MKRRLIIVKGIVQGVGFRPFVYRIAQELSLKGLIRNTMEGLVVDVEGTETDRLINLIEHSPPPLSRVEEIKVQHLPIKGFSDLKIVSSEQTGRFTLLSPDISICNDCLEELFNPKDRRYQYPFINCTNCGTRYSITFKTPYDRKNTTMRHFNMCSKCLREYEDPSDRRFHAQPNACALCGPSVSFLKTTGAEDDVDPLGQAVETLKKGGIIALKGIGGFHLCCNAEDEEAVALLRRRKRKSNKPFALMLPDIKHIKGICKVNALERDLLSGNRRPIVLLRKLKHGESTIKIAQSVSPNNSYYGCMLPYSPLHYLIFYYNQGNPHFNALVMTSGNLSEEPIVKDNEEALKRLSFFVDAFLLHNRDIFAAIDDSVTRVVEPPHFNKQPDKGSLQNRTPTTAGFAVFIRRARGYVPEPIDIKEDGEDVLGVGADIKNAFALGKGNYAIMSQHIGDMDNEKTLIFFEQTLATLSSVYGFKPSALGYDMHPDYRSSKWARDYGEKNNIKAFALQHHHCHIASVIAEFGLEGKIVGAALDGAGYGLDGNIWGSEFLLCQGAEFHRAASFEYLPLPGGDRASKECWRTALSLLRLNLREEDLLPTLEKTGFIKKYGFKRIETLISMIDKNLMTPLSSGAGRYFDAVSALIGCCDFNTFEGEAALALEGLIDEDIIEQGGSYSYTVKRNNNPDKPDYTVSFREVVNEIIEDILKGKEAKLISARFHNTIKSVVTEMLTTITSQYNTDQVALSGGVFQNLYLLRGVINGLIQQGLKVYCNSRVPSNDGGIAAGQVYIVRKLINTRGV